MDYMNAVDVVMVLIFVALSFRGAYVGFIKQTSLFVGIFVGVSVAANSYDILSPKIRSYFDSTVVADYVSYFIIFFLIFIAVGFIGSYLKNMLSMKFVPWFDHSLGCVLGAITALYLVDIMLLFLGRYPSMADYLRSSYLLPYIQKAHPFVSVFLPHTY